jgi:hypothetical protein
MRTFVAGLLIASAFAAGQDPAKQAVLQFNHTKSVQDFQEIANLIRTIGDFGTAGPTTTDNDHRIVTLSGTADQVALAEWLFKQLDEATPPQTPEASYTAGNQDVVRIFYLGKIATVQEFQEIANATRTMADIKYAFTVNSQKALAMRGSPDQMATAAWLIQNLNRSGQTPPAEYAAGADDVVHMFRLPYAASVQDFQEIANLVRTIGNIRRVFTVNDQRAVAMRGTADQMALAQWLTGELDPQGAKGPTHEYRVGVNDLVHVFYLPGAQSIQQFQQAASQVRSAASVRQMFVESGQRALAIRGTAEEMKISEETIRGLGL